MKKNTFLVVGSINQDMIFYDPIRNTKIGTIFQNYMMANGGKGNNQVSAVGKLGADAVLVGCVGNDYYGKCQIQALEELGVKTDCIEIREDMPTGLAYMGLKEDGTYNSSNAIGANAVLRKELVDKAIRKYDFDMAIMQIEMPAQTVYETYELCRKKSIPVILDPGPAQPFDLTPLQDIFIITPNEDETCALTGIYPADEEKARYAAEILVQKCNPEYVVLKLGSRGAYLYANEKGELIPSVSIDAVDSTGAGDTFTATLAICLGKGMEIRKAVRYANVAGGICVSRKGGQLSIPTMEEVQKLYEESYVI